MAERPIFAMRRTLAYLLLVLFATILLPCRHGAPLSTAAASQAVTPSGVTPAPPAKPKPEVQALINQGMAARKAYQWGEALRLYQEAREKAHALHDPAGEALALHEAGFVFAGA